MYHIHNIQYTILPNLQKNPKIDQSHGTEFPANEHSGALKTTLVIFIQNGSTKTLTAIQVRGYVFGNISVWRPRPWF